MSASPMNYAPLIKEIGRGAKGATHLSEAQAEALFGHILDGEVPDMELGAILLCMRIKGETLAEVQGFMAALQARTPQLAVPDGPRCVLLPTYNGARRQPNLMPLVALLLAREGIPVLIQGRHDFDSRVSPFALLEAMNITPAASLEDAEAQLGRGNPICLQLVQLVPGLDRLLALRPRLGLRNSGHTLAKLLDPCRGHSVKVVAVTHPEYLERMHEFLVTDQGSGMLLRGTEGEAYANPRRCPRLEGFQLGQARILVEAEEGGAPPLASLPDSPAIEHNVACIRGMLAGELPIPGPILKQVAALKELAQARA